MKKILVELTDTFKQNILNNNSEYQFVFVARNELNKNLITTIQPVALIVSSNTQVNSKLISQNNQTLKAVVSASVGFNNLDTVFLNKNGIQYFNCAGINKIAVMNYIFAVLCILSNADYHYFSNKTIGIIGYGTIGSYVGKCLDKWNIKYYYFDPLLKESEINNKYQLNTLDELFKICDIICIHSNLHTNELHPSYHLIDNKINDECLKNKIIINCARGEIIDENFMSQIIDKSNLQVYSDVFENEPNINTVYVNKIKLATFHIAGYSKNAKYRAVSNSLAHLSKLFNQDFTDCLNSNIQNLKVDRLIIDEVNVLDFNKQWLELVNTINQYIDLKSLHNQFITVLNDKDTQRISSKIFEVVRKSYQLRDEFDL